MSNSLFPEMEASPNSVFELKFDGPSFSGAIELSTFANELSGLNYCVNKIYAESIRRKYFDAQPFEYEFVIIGTESGSFKVYIKAVAKELVKPKSIAGGITAFVFTVLPMTFLDVMSTDHDKKNESQEMVQFRKDLLADREYGSSMGKMVSGLEKQTDSISFINANIENLTIDYSQKNFFTLIEADDYKYYTETRETVFARVVMVNLSARTNSIAVKVDDSGAMVECSFVTPVTQDELTNFLGKWVLIRGITQKLNSKREHIDIYEYELREAPSQNSLLAEIE